MQVTLINDSSVTIQGITFTLMKGTEVDLPCQTREHALEICAVLRLNADLSYIEDGVKYIAGAAGKFVAVPTEEVAVKVTKKKKVVEEVPKPTKKPRKT